MRKTNSLIRVVVAMMDDPTGRHWGYDLSRRSGIRSGVLYPILSRLLEEGWLEDGWEKASEITDGRPARRYYRITGAGASAMSTLLNEASQDARFLPALGSIGA